MPTGGGRFKQNTIFCDNSHGRSRNLFGSYGRGLGSHISSSRCLNKLALISFPCLIALSVALLNPPALTNLLDQHQSASATTGTAVAATPNLTLTNANTSASIDIAALDPIGSFATSSNNDSATFTLTTNNTTGYTLSIAADDDNGSLLRPVDNPGDTPDSLESISTITTTSDFSARTQEAATSYNGKWGIRPSKYVDTNTTTPVDNTGDNPVYLPSPTASNPTILDKTTAANTNNTENSYTIALGVRADHTIHAGTYSRTFKLLAVANPVSYSIAFNQNTNDTVTNMPSTQSSDAITSTTVTLPSTVPVRAHYSFLGWCNLQPTTTNGIDSCTGTNPTTGAAATVYNPNGNGTDLTYGIDHTTTNNATLYAMWKIDTFIQTTEVRYENADGTWGSYNTVDTQTLNYGASYSWSTAQITNFDSTAYQAASVSSYTVTEAHTNQVSIYRNTFTCYIQSRDQNAGGDYTSYTARVNTTLRYGQTCSWSASADSTYQAASYSATIISNISQSLDRNRQVYYLTVLRDSSYISSVSGSGYYRVGQAAIISATASSGNKFTYWAQTAGTTSSFSDIYSSSTYFYMPTSDATVYAYGEIKAFTQTTKVSYENADGTWGSYNTVDTQTLNYGSSYSWSTAQITNFDSTTYQAASVSSYTVTGTNTNYVSIYRNTRTCTKQYRLENADGTWGAYATASTEAIRYGGSCNYTATITDYRGSSSAANGAQGSTSASNITANTTLSLDFYRNTYSLTASAGSNTSSPSGSGTYRWGQSVTIFATKSTDQEGCVTFAAPTWSQSGTAGTIGTISQYSGDTYVMYFTMGKGNVTLTAKSSASRVEVDVTIVNNKNSSLTVTSSFFKGNIGPRLTKTVSLACGTTTSVTFTGSVSHVTAGTNLTWTQTGSNIGVGTLTVRGSGNVTIR